MYLLQTVVDYGWGHNSNFILYKSKSEFGISRASSGWNNYDSIVRNHMGEDKTVRLFRLEIIF